MLPAPINPGLGFKLVKLWELIPLLLVSSKGTEHPREDQTCKAFMGW